MKTKNKALVWLFAISVCISLYACMSETDPDYVDYRQIAWNSLTEEQKAIVTHDYREAVVSDSNDNVWDRPVVLVTFTTYEQDISGTITVAIDPETEEVLGNV